jgi:hypothetical protein
VADGLAQVPAPLTFWPVSEVLQLEALEARAAADAVQGLQYKGEKRGLVVLGACKSNVVHACATP